MSKKSTKALASATVMSLVLTTALSAAPVKAAAGQVTRTSGSDRYQTASQVAKANWKDGAKEVVLVSGEGYADAVSASVLAKTINAPILLSTAQTLSTDAKEALETLKPEKVYVIGGNASISKEVRDGLKAKYTLVELSGQNRYETNVAVANELVKNHGIKADNVMVVGGEGFSDALSVAPIAATKGQILLLGNNNEDSMKSVVEFVKANKSQVKVIGTKNVINEDMMKLLGTTDRVNGGSDRFNTNLEVLKAFKSDLKADKLYVANATGDGYADALVASALAGKAAAPLVLVDTEGSTSTANAVEYIKTNATKSTDLNVVGGTGVVSEATVKAIDKAVNGEDSHSSKTSVKSIKATSLNQVEVVFDGTVDADTAERVSNYEFDGSALSDTEAVASLGDDDKTLTITLAKAESQNKEISVKAKKGILTKDKMNTTKEFENKVTFKDVETPTLKDVVVRGNKKVVVTFSEAIKVSGTDKEKAAEEMAKNIKVDGQKISNYGIDIDYATVKNAIKVDGESAFWTNKVEFYLDSSIGDGKHTLKVEKDIFKDAVGFAVAETEKDFTVEKVTGAPKVKEATCDATGKISVKFDRAMEKETAQNAANYEVNGHNLKDLGITKDDFDFDDDDKTVTIEKVSKIEDDANVITVKDSIKDAFGNNLEDDVRLNFNKEKDTTKPKVVDVEPVDSETIHVRFSKDVKNSYATDVENYELKDKDGIDLINKENVTISALSENASDDASVYEIKFKNNVKLTAQKYTMTIKDIVDTTNDMNKMEECVETFSGTDDQDPEVVKNLAYQKSNDADKVVIFFSEEMDEDTLKDKANYKYIDGEGKTKDIPSDIKLDPSVDGKSVTLDFSNTTKKIDAAGTNKTSTYIHKIIVSNVKDVAGNEIPASKELDIVSAGSEATTVNFKSNSFVLQADGDDVKAIVQLDISVDDLKASDFTIDNIAADSARPVNGNVELTFEGNGGKTDVTKADKVKALGNDATITLKGTETTDVAGRVISAAGVKVYNNKLAPQIYGEWDAEGKEKRAVTFDVDAETATIHFDMPVENTNFKDDFKFVYNGHEIKVKDAKLADNKRDVVYSFENADLKTGETIIINAEKDNIDITTPDDQNGDHTKYTPSKDDLDSNSITITASETPVVDTKLEAAKKAVEKAKNSKTQVDIDAARALVNALPLGTDKDKLSADLDAISPIETTVNWVTNPSYSGITSTVKGAVDAAKVKAVKATVDGAEIAVTLNADGTFSIDVSGVEAGKKVMVKAYDENSKEVNSIEVIRGL